MSKRAVGHCLPQGTQSLRCRHAGYLPVKMLARVGEQTGQAAYALVNRIACFEKKSMLGVS